MNSAVGKRYDLWFVNGEGEILDFSATAITVLGRGGDWGALPFEPQVERNPEGTEGAVSTVLGSPGALSVQIGVSPVPGYPVWDTADDIERLIRPMLDDDSPNAGWLHWVRLEQTARPSEEWRLPVQPMPFPGWAPGVGETLFRFTGAIEFAALSGYWETAALAADRKVLKSAADATWSTVTVTDAPGGTAATYPTWHIGGPTAGTITGVKVRNDTTGKEFEFTNLSLGTGQELTVTTGFLNKTALIGATDVYSKRSTATQWFPLRPSPNSITITKNATSQSQVAVSYRRRRTGF